MKTVSELFDEFCLQTKAPPAFVDIARGIMVRFAEFCLLDRDSARLDADGSMPQESVFLLLNFLCDPNHTEEQCLEQVRRLRMAHVVEEAIKGGPLAKA